MLLLWGSPSRNSNWLVKELLKEGRTSPCRVPLVRQASGGHRPRRRRGAACASSRSLVTASAAVDFARRLQPYGLS